ncbi:MAG: dihydrofolate reductase [Gammaproteobacteria bacterium]|nr:MAG: dihydrofolate reductase [Gammaproteobacteria bacterium]
MPNLPTARDPQTPQRVSIVVAMARNGVIGAGGTLPWHLPADLRYFRSVTMGKPIIMGRRTHESIGRPLPGRHNIVVSSRPDFTPAPQCIRATSLAHALELAGPVEEAMVVGGAALYLEALAHAGRIYLTEVHARVEGDVRFPRFDRSQWREVERRDLPADEANPHPYSFVLLERVLPPALRPAR